MTTVTVDGTGSLPDQEIDSATGNTDEVLSGQNSEAGDEGSDDNSGDSSTSATGNQAGNPDERKTLLDAVRQAVRKDQGDAGASSTPKNDGAAQPNANTGEPEGTGGKKANASDDANLPFHNHPRWKEVLAERDGFKDDATQYRVITSFMTDQGLQPDEVAEGMLVMGMMKNQPEEALKHLETHAANIREFLGLGLPADLQKQVDEGLVTEELAKETAKLRRVNEASEQRVTRDNEAREAQANQDHRASLKSAVDSWEVGMRQRDPDFASIAKLVTTQVKLDIREKGVPRTAEDAVKMAEAAHATVKASMGHLAPKRQATPKTPTNSRNSTNAAGQPKTLAEAVRIGAQQSA